MGYFNFNIILLIFLNLFKSVIIYNIFLIIYYIILRSVLLIGFIVSSSFIYNLQEKMTNLQINETFRVTINDVYKDIKDKSDASLLEKTKLIKSIYLQDKTKPLEEIALEYNVSDINIIQADGLIKNSTQEKLIDSYNMNDSDQSKEFMILVTDDRVNEFVQDFRAMGIDGKTMRKFAGVTLEEGGFIQVGYNTEQFRDNLDNFVIDVTKNRKVGATGFIAVCDENLKLVTSTDRNGQHISSLGLNPNDEMNRGLSASQIYETEIKNIENDYKERYIYVFSFVENYCIVAAIPEVEAMLMRDASIYLNSFSLIILLTMLFIIIYYLVKKTIIKNLNQINDNLKQITNGDLSVVIENHSSHELEFLANGINSTVDSLNRYIKEANERIDKELEYAKEIQKSALPKNFIVNNDYILFADMIPAKEVGGDFYDFYKIGENKIAFLVADVSGKGIPAAMFMMKAKIIIKDLAESGISIEEIFSITNEKLCENNVSNMFVTAWMGILDLNTKILKFANAGHNPPIIFNEGQYKKLKNKPNFILGGMEGIKYKSNQLNFKDGDRIFIYTDGVIEAINKEKESYGEDRLIGFLNKNKDNHSNELLVRLKEDIDDFANTEPQFDDITMLYFELKEKIDLEKMINEKTFLADDSNLENVFNFVEDSLENINISNKIVNSLNLAVEEIFVNISHYGYENNQGTAKIEIYFEENLNQIKIKIIDNGKPFNPLLKDDPDITLSADERDIGGLGIFITKKLMDEVFYEYKDNQNILTLIKNI